MYFEMWISRADIQVQRITSPGANLVLLVRDEYLIDDSDGVCCSPVVLGGTFFLLIMMLPSGSYRYTFGESCVKNDRTSMIRGKDDQIEFGSIIVVLMLGLYRVRGTKHMKDLGRRTSIDIELM